jgi:hypothetical protein
MGENLGRVLRIRDFSKRKNARKNCEENNEKYFIGFVWDGKRRDGDRPLKRRVAGDAANNLSLLTAVMQAQRTTKMDL